MKTKLKLKEEKLLNKRHIERFLSVQVIKKVMAREVDKINKEMKKIKSKLNKLEKEIPVSDLILTKEEIKQIDQAIKEYKEGKTISLEELKKELKI